MTTPTLTEALGRLRRSIEWLRDGKPHANGIGVADMVVLEDGFRARAAEIERLTKLADERGANEARMLERNAELQAEVERLRGLAATCYAGLGAECDLPEAWLDALNAAANGEPFSTEGLLPYIAAPAQQDTTAPAGRARLAESGGSRACAVVPDPSLTVGEREAPTKGDNFAQVAAQRARITDAMIDAVAPYCQAKSRDLAHAALERAFAVAGAPVAAKPEFNAAMGEWLTAVGELYLAMGRPDFKADEPVLGVVETLREAARRLSHQPAQGVEDERAAFEAWAGGRGMQIAWVPGADTYASAYTAYFWTAWQARAALAQAPAAEPLTDEQITMDGLMMCPTKTLDNCADAFEAGVRYAERAHGIGAA
jgi:hypothetical protein